MLELIGIIASALVILLCVLYIFILKGREPQNISLDDIVGEKCKVIELVDNYAGCGLVKVKGTEWSARGVDDDDVFEEGESLIVVAIEGAKLVCMKK